MRFIFKSPYSRVLSYKSLDSRSRRKSWDPAQSVPVFGSSKPVFNVSKRVINLIVRSNSEGRKKQKTRVFWDKKLTPLLLAELRKAEQSRPEIKKKYVQKSGCSKSTVDKLVTELEQKHPEIKLEKQPKSKQELDSETRIDWEKLQKQLFLEVDPEKWISHKKPDENTLCVIFHPNLLLEKNEQKFMDLVRNNLVLKAEALARNANETLAVSQVNKNDNLLQDDLKGPSQAQNVVKPNLLAWVLSGQAELESYREAVKNGELNKNQVPFSDEFRAILFASCLGDGSIFKSNIKDRNKQALRFRLTQTAFETTQTKNPQSHLEYVLWFYRQLHPRNKRPRTLFFTKSVKLKKDRNGVEMAWQIGVEIHEHPQVEALYSLFYNPKKLANNEQKKKRLPDTEVLKEYFSDGRFVDLMLAHLFMQDGGDSNRLISQGSDYRTAVFYIFTRDREMCERFAYVLWNTTGLKLKPRFVEQQKGTSLCVCQSSLGEFMTRIEPYILPCMAYKLIDVNPQTLNTEIIEAENKEFDSNLTNWIAKFGKWRA